MTVRARDLVYSAAIIGAPTIYLANLSLAYALVPWVCTTGHIGALHASSAIGLLLVLAPLAFGWRIFRHPVDVEGASSDTSSRFLADIAIASILLFALATILQWFAQFAIGPCTT